MFIKFLLKLLKLIANKTLKVLLKKDIIDNVVVELSDLLNKVVKHCDKKLADKKSNEKK